MNVFKQRFATGRHDACRLAFPTFELIGNLLSPLKLHYDEICTDTAERAAIDFSDRWVGIWNRRYTESHLALLGKTWNFQSSSIYVVLCGETNDPRIPDNSKSATGATCMNQPIVHSVLAAGYTIWYRYTWMTIVRGWTFGHCVSGAHESWLLTLPWPLFWSNW